MKQFWQQNKLVVAILLFALATTAYLYTPPGEKVADTQIRSEDIHQAVLIETSASSKVDIPIEVQNNEEAPNTSSKPLQQEETVQAEVKEQGIDITLTVPETGFSSTLDVPEGSTVYDAMKLMSETTEFTFHAESYGHLGVFIDTIAGIKNDTIRALYWIYAVNGQKATKGVSQYTLQPHDIITWTYESSEN